MKTSECHQCEHYQPRKGQHPLCLIAGKTLLSIDTCPKEEPVNPWTPEEKERLTRLLNSGTHPRNVALIMKRPYNEVEEKMMQKYAPLEEAQSCVNCGRGKYCHKQYVEGCNFEQWIRLTPEQVTERFIMHFRREGFSWIKF